MKGDFSRVTFDRRHHYAAVLFQQGRVLTDADLNESQAVGRYRDETATGHMIGRAGTPKVDEMGGVILPAGGFALTMDGDGMLQIGPGHYYVDGILCENEAPAAYDEQPYLHAPPAIDALLEEAGATVGLVYLDLFLRERSTLDEPAMRERALNGPDTSRRAQVVWQVKVLPLPELAAPSASVRTRAATARNALAQLLAADNAAERQTRRRALHQAVIALEEVATPTGMACDAPLPPWDALTGPRTAAMDVQTPPVSDDAGPCDAPPGAGYLGTGENQLYRVEVHSTGAGGGRAESFIKWSRENGSVVAQIQRVGAATSGEVSGATLTVHSTGRDSNLGFQDGDWVEYVDDLLALRDGAGHLVQIDHVEHANNQIVLRDDVTVRFDYHPKLLRWDQSGDDATGDGVAMNGADDAWITLERNIQVSFAEGIYRPGDYWLIPARAESGQVEFGDGFQPPADVHHHYTRLGYLFRSDGGPEMLLDCRQLLPPLTGLAAEDIAFDNRVCDLPDTRTVQDALEQLCRRPGGGGPSPCVVVGTETTARLDETMDKLLEAGETTFCLCLLPGEYVISDRIWDVLGARRGLHLTIKGCGPETRIRIQERLVLRGWASVTLRDVAVEYAVPVQRELGLRLERCRKVTVDGCHFEGATAGGALLLLDDVDRAQVAASQFEAVSGAGFGPVRDLLLETGDLLGVVGEMLDPQMPGRVYAERINEIGEKFVDFPQDERQALSKQIQSMSSDLPLSDEVRFAFTKFSLVLAAEAPRPVDLAATLLDLRRAALRARPGIALLLNNGELIRIGEEFPEIGQVARFDVDDQITLRDNRVDGLLALYGPPMNPDEEMKFIENLGRLQELQDRLFLVELAGSSLHLLDNRLLKVTMPWMLWEQLLRTAQSEGGEGEWQILFRELIIQGNVITEDRNALVAGRITMANNVFTKNPRDDLGILAVTMAHSAVYTANQGQGDEDSNLTVRHIARFPRNIRPYAAINHGFNLV